jgi:hypothetical protein
VNVAAPRRTRLLLAVFAAYWSTRRRRAGESAAPRTGRGNRRSDAGGLSRHRRHARAGAGRHRDRHHPRRRPSRPDGGTPDLRRAPRPDRSPR